MPFVHTTNARPFDERRKICDYEFLFKIFGCVNITSSLFIEFIELYSFAALFFIFIYIMWCTDGQFLLKWTFLNLQKVDDMKFNFLGEYWWKKVVASSVTLLNQHQWSFLKFHSTKYFWKAMVKLRWNVIIFQWQHSFETIQEKTAIPTCYYNEIQCILKLHFWVVSIIVLYLQRLYLVVINL